MKSKRVNKNSCSCSKMLQIRQRTVD